MKDEKSEKIHSEKIVFVKKFELGKNVENMMKERLEEMKDGERIV
jgi:hypothetical protein